MTVAAGLSHRDCVGIVCDDTTGSECTNMDRPCGPLVMDGTATKEAEGKVGAETQWATEWVLVGMLVMPEIFCRRTEYRTRLAGKRAAGLIDPVSATWSAEMDNLMKDAAVDVCNDMKTRGMKLSDLARAVAGVARSAHPLFVRQICDRMLLEMVRTSGEHGIYTEQEMLSKMNALASAHTQDAEAAQVQ